MSLLSNPKVRLGLIVNGLYFISLFTPATPHTRPRLFRHAHENEEAGAASKLPPLPPMPAPPSAPSKATTSVAKDFDQLDVYLTNDLTLVDRPGHRLLLSPTFTTTASKPEPPDSVLLRFISSSDERMFSDYTPFNLTADGEAKLDERTHFWYGGDVALVGHGRPVVEGVGVELPYDVFVEIGNARQVIVQLGPDRVQLSTQQIEALRDMHRRVSHPDDPPPSAAKPHRSNEAAGKPAVIQTLPVLAPPDRRQ